jgi:phage repressor protein C with HTH and peptisase S24 domain
MRHYFTRNYKEIIGEKGVENLRQLAQKAGIGYNTVRDFALKGKNPGTKTLSALSKTLSVSVDYLLTGRENPLDAGKDLAVQSARELAEGDFVLIPQMRGEIAAGRGLIPDDSADIRVAFRRDWIQRRGDPSRMSLIRVSGDSMEPTLQSGDLVLVDHNHNFLDPSGGIYAVAVNDHIMVKRIQFFPRQNRVKIISDNAVRYEAEEHPADDVNINGKVIWFGREIER